MENKKEFILAGVFFIVIITAGAGYFFWQNQSSDTSFVTTQNSDSSGGIIKSFSDPQPQPVLGDNVSQPTPTPAEEEVATAPEVQSASTADKTYALQLPNGWSKSDSKSEKDPCQEDQKIKTDTYKNGSETLVVYENGHPGGCDRSGVADVYLDFDYTEDFTGLEVATNKIEQCSKDDNPDCPKGDGRVSVFIGNRQGSSAKEFTPNDITEKTYFFSLTDTTVDPSLENQVKSLAALVERISFE